MQLVAMLVTGIVIVLSGESIVWCEYIRNRADNGLKLCAMHLHRQVYSIMIAGNYTARNLLCEEI